MREEIIGNARLILGDCREVLASLREGEFDAVVTDPPYQEKTHKGSLEDIDFAPLESHEIANLMLASSRGWVLAFCEFEQLGHYQQAAGDSYIRGGVWDKVTQMPQLTGDRPAQWGEAIAIMHPAGRKVWNGGGRAAMWRCIRDDDKEHPTQKPVKLMGMLLQDFASPGMHILDPFMGSGTTGIACMKLGMRFTGIEMSEKHFDTACGRIGRAHSQPDMFVGAAVPAEQLSLLSPDEAFDKAVKKGMFNGLVSKPQPV